MRTAALDALGLLNEATRDAVTQELLHEPAPEVRAAAARYDADLTRVHEPADLPHNGYAYRGLLRERRLSRPLIAHVLAIDADDRNGATAPCRPTCWTRCSSTRRPMSGAVWPSVTI